jgi:hypothetical protein
VGVNFNQCFFLRTKPICFGKIVGVNLYKPKIKVMLLNVMGEPVAEWSEYTPINPTLEHFYIVIFFVIMFLLWLFRNVPIIGSIWKITIWFFGILFLTLFANYAKKEIKLWWDND